MKVAAVVPSLNPDELFTSVIEDLVDAGFKRIYVVNDGSDSSYDHYFDGAAAHPECILLKHEVNCGKGRALKTAFEHHLSAPDSYVGLVTLDGDGQHKIEDVVRVAEELELYPDALVLGARNFSQDNVPKKSAMGNKLTRTIFRIACGMPISDTQTGLRGIPNGYARTLLGVQGERYEFETNMLLETKRAHVPIREVTISTIYLDDNSRSHFRPLTDGLRIYWLILKFTFASLAGFVVDIVLFTLLNWLLSPHMVAAQSLLIATVAARICSALFNFSINYRVVFKSRSHVAGSMMRYAAVAVVQLACSYGGVYLLSEVLPLPATPAKIIVDLALFFASFFVQRRWVFRSA